MMKTEKRLFVLLAMIVPLIACTTLLSSKQAEEEPEIDLFELERTADIAYQENNLVESEQQYLELAKRLPEQSIHWFRLGNIYARSQRPDAAIVAYREAVLRDPKYTKAWYNMGIIQLRQAANSLNEMQIYADREDPLFDKGKGLLDDILKIIKQD